MITFKKFITEARRNPHLNPKLPINYHISQHYENADKIRGTQIVNSFVSFTDVDKLGINPGSEYNTPLGIYSYPSEYVIEITGSSSSMKSLPFAGDSAYANVFSVDGNIIDLSNMSDRDFTRYAQKVVDVYIEVARIRRGTDEWKQAVDYLEDNVILNASVEASNPSIVGSKFWWLTRRMADVLREHTATKSRWRATKHPVSWNKLFRTLGIDGCIDSKGDGIIHTSEPFQAVFFSTKPIKGVERHYNKYSPDDVLQSKLYGDTVKMFKELDPDVLVRDMERDPNKYRAFDSEFIASIHPLEPKVQRALLKALLDNDMTIISDSSRLLTDNPHVFSKVGDKFVLDMTLKRHETMMYFIQAGLLNEDNMTPKQVEIMFDKRGITSYAFGIREYAPNMMDKILDMISINSGNVENFVKFGKMYFSKMRAGDKVVDRLIKFGNILLDFSGSDAEVIMLEMQDVLAKTAFDSNDSMKVMDAVFGD